MCFQNNLSTLSNCCQVAVFNQGQMIECDTASNLLNDENSKLSTLVKTGIVK